MLHNIYPTKILLYKIGKADSNQCDACHTGETDYIEHFFYACRSIKPIRYLVSQEIMIKFAERLSITQNIALIGCKDNNLISLAKMCISIFMYGERTPKSIMLNRLLSLREYIRQ